MSLGYLSTIVRTMSICSMVRFTAAGPVIEAGMNTDQNCAPSWPLRLRGMSVISEILPTPPPRVLPCRFVVSAARSMLPTLSKPLRMAPGRSLWPSVRGVRVSTRSTRFCNWASWAAEGAPWANAASGKVNSKEARIGSLVMAWSGSGGMNPKYCRFMLAGWRAGGPRPGARPATPAAPHWSGSWPLSKVARSLRPPPGTRHARHTPSIPGDLSGRPGLRHDGRVPGIVDIDHHQAGRRSACRPHRDQRAGRHRRPEFPRRAALDTHAAHAGRRPCLGPDRGELHLGLRLRARRSFREVHRRYRALRRHGPPAPEGSHQGARGRRHPAREGREPHRPDLRLPECRAAGRRRLAGGHLRRAWR